MKTHITEKSTILSEKANTPSYSFIVSSSLNKQQVKKDFFAKYKIKPTRVNIIRVSQGKKKAVVFLKKGEKIEFI